MAVVPFFPLAIMLSNKVFPYLSPEVSFIDKRKVKTKIEKPRGDAKQLLTILR